MIVHLILSVSLSNKKGREKEAKASTALDGCGCANSSRSSSAVGRLYLAFFGPLWGKETNVQIETTRSCETGKGITDLSQDDAIS